MIQKQLVEQERDLKDQKRQIEIVDVQINQYLTDKKLQEFKVSWGLMMQLWGISANLNDGITTPGYLLPIILIASIWINDTMAYIVGSFIGKTPLSSISPKKTVEGTAGGAVLAVVAVTLGCKYLFHIDNVKLLLIISATAAIVGTLGDLLESKLKRMAGIKDSGQIMPGHGGFLDRFDSLLLAMPFVWLLIEVLL